MRRRLFLWIVCFFAVAVAPVHAAPMPAHAHFTGTVSPAPKAGQTVMVTLHAAIDPGWHLYSLVPATGGPFPTVLDPAGPGWKPLGKATEDTPIHMHDPNFGVDVMYHEVAATFQQRFLVTKMVAKPTIMVHFQTCNATVCLPPSQVVVPLMVTRSAPPPLMPTALPPSHAANAGSVGLGLFLLGAFGAGLLTLITPCVFPLIPITLTSFVKQADGDRGKLVRLSGGYAAGIVALYVGLGVLVTALYGAAGLNRLGANPWVNLLIFALFVVFALSFFETITLRLPVDLSALQASGRRHGGIVGLALLGIAFVLASFTCIVPFVGTLLVASASGPAFRTTLGFLAYAVAFASPFLVFALFPQWISRIPRSGAWLMRAKATFGFLELAASLKFLSNADLYWQWKLLTEPVLLVLWTAIFASGALYLSWGGRVSWGRGLTTSVFLFAAGYCVWGLSGRPINLLATYLPPAGYGGASAPVAKGVLWLTDYGQALAEARAENKPLLINFTGNFCTNCRYNENNVFPDGAVQRQLTQFVRVELYTDGKNDMANQKLQLAKFGDISLPLYGVVNPQSGQVLGKTAGVMTPSKFVEFLSQARNTAVASR